MSINNSEVVSGIIKPLKQRLEAKISKENGCWLFTGYVNNGYGYIYNNKKNHLCHRISWELYRGPIPEGLVVRHRCPNKRKNCCNPEHLLLGTQQDNINDTIEDGTVASKLTENQVIEFLEHYPNIQGYNWPYCQEKAKELQVSTKTLFDIVKGRTWTHITGL